MSNLIKHYKEFLDVPVRNIFFLSLLSLMGSVQVFVALVWVGHFFRKTPPTAGVFPESARFFSNEYISHWTVVFIAAALIVQTIVFVTARKSMNDPSLPGRLRFFAWVEVLLTFLILSAVFKIFVYDDRPQLAQYACWVLLFAAVFNKIFWRKVMAFTTQAYQFFFAPHNGAILRQIFFGCFIGFIFFIIYVPNPEAAVARMFFGEQFHHMDGVVVGSAWAYASGCVLNMDVISRYGLGMPIVVSTLTKLFGGFSYPSILLVLVWTAIVYYWLWFAFLRNWFGSLMVAAVTMLVALRVQLFHTGNYPFIFTYPSSTPMRFCFDIIFIWFIFKHLQSHGRAYLWAAGFICGFSIFYMTAEGIYLTLAFYFYLVAHILAPHARGYIYRSSRDIPTVIAYFACPFLVTLAFIYLAQGQHMFSREYWDNMAEFSNFFLSGFGDFPIYQSLRGHLYLQSLMGFLYPVVYVVTLVAIASLWFLKKIDYKEIIVAVLCVYGLGLYHYYVVLSMWTSYYMNGLPFIFICGYWLNYWAGFLKKDVRIKVLCVLLGISAYALLTNHNFISYPNFMNISRNPLVDPLVAQQLPNRKPYFNHLFYEYPEAYKLPANSWGGKDEGLKAEQDFRSDDELLDLYRKETDFSQDVALIQKLTSADEKVAVFSSFEIMMLMQAKRKPFFYYCPIVNSRPLRMRNFVVTAMYTTDHLKKTLGQLEKDRPAYVFLERILLTPQVPQAYFYDSPGLFELLNYIFLNYEAVENGQYLVALRRKGFV